MTSNHILAGRDMNDLVIAAWNAGAAAIVGYVPELRYQGVEAPEPDSAKYWARLTRQTVFEEQSGLGAGFEDGRAKYDEAGLHFVQLFGPRSDAQGWSKLNRLAVLARNATRGKKSASGVWFRNVRIRELEAEPKWQRINVVAEYEFSEIG